MLLNYALYSRIGSNIIEIGKQVHYGFEVELFLSGEEVLLARYDGSFVDNFANIS